MSRGVSARNGTQGRYNTLIGFEWVKPEKDIEI
jgi:hypothetical protein